MKERARELVAQGDRFFEQRRPLLDLWQSIAENFYPYRADFSTSRSLGEEFASHLMNSRPLLAHRDLTAAMSAILRPREEVWAHLRTHDEQINTDPAARAWLDHKSEIQHRVMYDREAGLVRATKQGDGDFIAFGQCVIECSPNGMLNGILHRNWHLRDTVWSENAEMKIDRVDRNWKIGARELAKLFPKTIDEKVREAAEKDPYAEIGCRHIVLPADDYDLGDRNRRGLPWVSLYVDCENETVLEEVPRRRFGYVIPRWLTISGSQYAYAPTTVAALADARMLQQIGLTLLEAGQKAVDPPLKATHEAIVGGVNAFAGGITWIDREYDEKSGAALERLMDQPLGLNWGDRREEKIEAMLAEAFYLNRITLPDLSKGQMTAFEVAERLKEYRRAALPLFEPMEVEYNAALCEEDFELILGMGGFGPLDDMPEVLRGQEIRWQFDSPLQAASERGKVQAFAEAQQLLSAAMGIDPSTRHDFDVHKAFREALTAGPADWIVSEDEAEAARQADAQAAAAQRAAEMIGQGADLAARIGEGAGLLNAAAQG